ncbi:MULTISPECIES: LON peptidase substrate-binding domain-containing protein [Luteimonas]|uniref:ATP-dependent protease n=1 Tax=Luteimonas chenhongjianii TaxID=2006110 RepID=A0A290XAZ3_9GAMM|nr:MULTISPECIES: LON peptidase substrate-binding domain-containing protein [Luteimonas]ATD66290.1 ATP-dependent protease [Luteimonas chenhongjianii]RPD85466.1 ATP-dependent protease [Luteimonas sp. 100069]
MADDTSLPLFPLRTVLVPGAALALRVFEPRYLDLVRECGRRGTGFGICLILEGDEVGTPATPAGIGTEALIEDFDMGADGLLTLRVRGGRRFHVRRTRVRDSGLVVADVDWCAPDPTIDLQPEHAVLGLVLRKILEHIDGAGQAFPEPHFDDAAWVGWRLAELLPLEQPKRQLLLQQDDPDVRLETLLRLVDDD